MTTRARQVKSSSPVFVLLLSFAAGIVKPSRRLAASILLMAAGLALSIEGELNFNALGFAMCLGAGFLAALRIVLSHTVLHGEGRDGLDSITLLYIAAPSSAASILPVAIPLEMSSIIESNFYRDASLFWFTLWCVLAGGILAINLNFSEFVLVGRTSALTLNVAGNIKVVAVSILSVILFKTRISTMNILGYVVCGLGVWLYKAEKSQKDQESLHAEENNTDGEELLPRSNQHDEIHAGLQSENDAADREEKP